MLYFDELTKAMSWLGEQRDTIFLGQNIVYGGNALFKTFSGVPKDKLIELPVAEEMQLGMSIGLSLAGKVPICIFPRMDFMMCCMNQLVNHLDKNIYPAKVIIRTAIGSTKPLHPGKQHCGDYAKGLSHLLENITIWKIKMVSQIMPLYEFAYGSRTSSIIIEKVEDYERES